MRKRLILGGSVFVVLALGLTLSLFALAPHSAFAATVRHVKTNCGGQMPPACYTTIHDAVNAAVAGDTILVHPGTFTETNTLNITVPIRLQGSGADATILRGSLPLAIAITLSKPGTLTIAGFTIEGNALPYTGSSLLIQITDAQASNAIRIGNNTFVSTSATDPNHATNFTEALHNFDSTSARLDLLKNTFEGFSWGSELFNFVGPVRVEGNQVFDLNGGGVSGHVGFDEFTCCDTLDIPNQHLYRLNTFSKYVGAGLLVESNEARFDDLEVLKNTLDLAGPNGIGAISIGGFGQAGYVKLAASDNVIHLGGAIDGIQINQGVSGTVAHNVITGNSTGGTNGIAVSIGSNLPTSLTIRDNRVTTYDTGLSLTNASSPSGSAAQTVTATANCILNNATFGANNTTAIPTAITPDATKNWWGAASGPFNAVSNPGGTGNAVSDNVSFIPFLTAPSPTCP